jgi:serine/threonine protein phosphatase PrpC
MTRLRSAAASDVGRVRKSNQDLALESDLVYAVADGMGGHAGGETAARTAIEALVAHFSPPATPERLAAAVQAANLAVWRRGQSDEHLRGMGTTLTALAPVDGDDGQDRLAVANIGDSRAYVLKRGELIQITEDHSLVEQMVREGELTPEEAETHPKRHVLTRALGVDPEVEVDLWEVLPVVGDRFLLCSDGLVNEVSDVEIADVLRQYRDAQSAAAELVRRARAHGGSDNITLVIVDVVGDSEEAGSVDTHATGSSERSAGVMLTPPVPATVGTEADGGSSPGLPTNGAARLGAARGPSDASPRGGSAGASGGAHSLVGVAAAHPPTSSSRLRFGGTTALAERPASDGRSSLQELAWRYGQRDSGHRRGVTVRTVAFLVLLAVVLGGSVGFLYWFNDASWYVGLDGRHLAIYHGRAGGLLWIHPTLEAESPVTTSDVVPARIPELRDGIAEPSREAASRLILNLVNERNSLPASGTSSATSASGTSRSSGHSTTATTSASVSAGGSSSTASGSASP